MSLCCQMPGTTRDQYLRYFRSRIEQAANKLKILDEDACVVILIDVADNAEIAATEREEYCFAHEVMQEPPPSGVRIVSLCRTERKHLLKLHPGDYLDLPLQEFDKAETQQILEAKFPSAILTEIDIDEFHRLSGGNPRVQANALDQAESLEKAVEYLGPYRTSVDEQIAFHLQSVINDIKKKHPDINVDLLCSGLAILPPFIPIIVLAESHEC